MAGVAWGLFVLRMGKGKEGKERDLFKNPEIQGQIACSHIHCLGNLWGEKFSQIGTGKKLFQ